MNRRTRMWLMYTLGLPLTIALTVHLLHRQSINVFERLSSYALYPFLRAHNAIITPLHNFFAHKQTTNQLEQSLNTLKNERDDLMAENIELQSKLFYLDTIKDLTQLDKQFSDMHVCTAQIIATSFSDYGHFFLIDTGSDKGIKPDMVVTYKRSLLGKVFQVYPWYSKVRAITDESCKVPACCLKTKTAGIHEGVNKLDVTHLQFVSHLETVETGDYIISSGQGLIFPQGLALGYITSSTRNGLYYDIEVMPMEDITKLQYCTVLDRGKTACKTQKEVVSPT